MIDLHCHILPGMDDGPADMPESLDMARQAVDDGIHAIVATPHTLNGLYENTGPAVTEAVKRFRNALLSEGIPIEIYPGSDAHLDIKMVDKIKDGAALTINGAGRYLLVEFPNHAVPHGAKEELFQLLINGITPIITHPERNFVIQNATDILYELLSMGCLTQITAMSITGKFGEEAMASAHKMLELRMAHVIASDAHGRTLRPPLLSRAVQIAARILGRNEEAEEMVCGRPEAILRGEPLSLPEPRRRRRRWWRAR